MKEQKRKGTAGKKAANSFPGQRFPFTSSAARSRAGENKNDLAKRLFPLSLFSKPDKLERTPPPLPFSTSFFPPRWKTRRPTTSS